MQKEVRVSLSRAHKIAERLKDRAQEQQAEAIRLSDSTQVYGLAGAAQMERLSAQSALALQAMAQADRYWQAFSEVRKVIAAENHRRGIDSMLGQLDALNKCSAIRRDMLARADERAMPLSELRDYQPLNAESRMGLTVRMLSAEDTAVLRQSLKDLQRKAIALSDEIATANSTALALALDVDLAEEVTG